MQATRTLEDRCHRNGQRIEGQGHDGEPQRLRPLAAEGEHDDLHKQDRDRLRGEVPGDGRLAVDLYDGHEGEEDPEAQRVVHACGASEGGQRDGDRRPRLLTGVVERRDELGGIGRERGQDEGHVEGRDAGPFRQLREAIDHRVGEEDDEHRARQHLPRRADLNPAHPLGRGGKLLNVFRHLRLRLIIVVVLVVVFLAASVGQRLHLFALGSEARDNGGVRRKVKGR